MLVQITKSLSKIGFVLSVILLSACSPIKQYSETDNPNFTLRLIKIEDQFMGGLFSFLFSDDYLDMHVHIDPAKNSKVAKCVPGKNRWYVGSITKLKENRSKSIYLPIGQRAYIVIRHTIHGNPVRENTIVFDLLPKEEEKYEFTIKQTKIAKSEALSVWKNGKKQPLSTNDWKNCF